MGYYEYRPVGIAFIAIALFFGVWHRFIWFPLPTHWWYNPFLFLITCQVCIGIILMIVEVDSANNLQVVKGLYYVGMIFTFLEMLSFIIFPRAYLYLF